MKTSVRYYLLAYNGIAFCFWAAYFFLFLAQGLQLTPMALLLLNIAQGMAFLEILHTLFKWVKSPVGSTAAQVVSRLLVLAIINVLVQRNQMMPIAYTGLCIVSFAWSITELVRYSFYFLGLIDIQPKALLWMRYTFFILLYPAGVTGEWLLLFTPIIAVGYTFNSYMAFAIVTALTYAYYFPVLYKYMWKQRHAKLGV